MQLVVRLSVSLSGSRNDRRRDIWYGFFYQILFRQGKQLTADLTLVLALGTIVPVEILERGTTAGTAEVHRDFDISSAADRLGFTAVMAALVFQAEMFPVLVSGRDDLQKGICLKLFVLRRDESFRGTERNPRIGTLNCIVSENIFKLAWKKKHEPWRKSYFQTHDTIAESSEWKLWVIRWKILTSSL